MGATANDQEAAEKVAQWLRENSTETRTWYEVRTLLQDFEVDRFTEDGQNRITSALQDVGIVVEPALSTRERRDTIMLKWADGRTADQAKARRPAPPRPAVITARVARRDGTVAQVPFDAVADEADAVARWFDLPHDQASQSRRLTTMLAPLCPGLTDEMVEDLLSPDPRPKVVRYDGGTIRALATFRVSAIESDEGAAEKGHSMAGILVFDPVEILVGPGWMVTCWHETQRFRGAHRLKELPPAPHEETYAAVGTAWNDTYTGAGDLAVLLLLELADSYKPACRQLRVWEEEWELDYFRTDHVYEDTLVETQASLAVLRDWLSPMNISGMRADLRRAWFPGLSGNREAGGQERALRIDDRVDQSLRELHEISDLVRNSYELLEVRRLKKAQDRDAKFQRTIAIGGSAILIPTLVAGVMGANTWVPGEYGPDSAKWAFGVLLLVMVISAAVAWIALKRMHDGNS